MIGKMILTHSIEDMRLMKALLRQESGYGSDFMVPDAGPAHYSGFIDITDVASWKSTYKLSSECSIPASNTTT